MLIKTVDELKHHLGRAINKATTDEFLLPYVRLAQDEFIRPAIGAELLQELDTQYNATDPLAGLSPANAKLLGLIQRTLTFYAYWKYLPYAIGNDGDNGLQEQATDKTSPLRIGVLEKRLRETIQNATATLEVALTYLEKHKADYPTWRSSPAYQESRSLFIFSATELTTYLPLAGKSYRFYLALRPYLKKAEKNEIRPVLGRDCFQLLKARYQTDTLGVADQELLEYVNEALAACAYRDALFHLNVVQTSGSGLRILSEFDGINNEKAPDAKLLLEAQARAQASAGQKLNSLKAFLEASADTYPGYQTGTKKPNDLPDNTGYAGIFRMR